MSYIVRVNQFTDGPSGHVNISWILNGTVVATYGANLSPSIGVQEESLATANRIATVGSAYSYQDIYVSQSHFNSSLGFAQAADQGHNAYSIFCNNCVDFANEVLNRLGFQPWSIKDFLLDGSLTDIYANVAKFLCTNPYAALMDSLWNDYTFTPPPYVSAYYQSIFGGAPMFWTGDYLTLHEFLQDQLGVSSWEDYISALAEDYAAHGSPIAIDLDGNGLHTISLENSAVSFDVTGDGVAERTGWLSGGDAFLVRDTNANGLVDGVNEMFGGLARGDGYRELAALDDNADGIIDSRDASFGSLLLWRDGDVDGITDAGELMSLAEAAVDHLELTYASHDGYRDEGNLIGETSSAMVAGRIAEMGDIYFRHERPVAGEQGTQSQLSSLLAAMAAFQPAGSGAGIPQAPSTTEYMLAAQST